MKIGAFNRSLALDLVQPLPQGAVMELPPEPEPQAKPEAAAEQDAGTDTAIAIISHSMHEPLPWAVGEGGIKRVPARAVWERFDAIAKAKGGTGITHYSNWWLRNAVNGKAPLVEPGDYLLAKVGQQDLPDDEAVQVAPDGVAQWGGHNRVDHLLSEDGVVHLLNNINTVEAREMSVATGTMGHPGRPREPSRRPTGAGRRSPRSQTGCQRRICPATGFFQGAIATLLAPEGDDDAGGYVGAMVAPVAAPAKTATKISPSNTTHHS